MRPSEQSVSCQASLVSLIHTKINELATPSQSFSRLFDEGPLNLHLLFSWPVFSFKCENSLRSIS